MTELLYRRNVVLEALRAGRRDIHKLTVAHDADPNSIAPVIAAAESRGVPIEHAFKKDLNLRLKGARHQGALLEVGPYTYFELQDILERAVTQNEPPLLLLLDLVHSPSNVGRLLRSAEATGIHGVIMQDRRAGEITPAVVDASMGASEHMLVARVTNLVQTMRLLSKEDIWLAGLDLGETARPLWQVDLNMPLGLVVGNEGSGLRRLVRKHCDLLLYIPMRGRVASLNAAIAGSVVLYAAWQARGFPELDQPSSH